MAQQQEPDVVLAKDVPVVAAPQWGPNSKINWDKPANDPNLRENVGEVAAPKPDFGPGSKVNWDNPKADPNKRKHVGLDPGGTANAKLT